MMFRTFLSTLSLLTFISVSLNADESRPLMQFDFSKTDSKGIVRNSGYGPYQAKITGKYKILPGGVLQMDGLTTQVVVEGSEKFDVTRNATFTLLYKREELPGNDASNRSMDAFFCKPGEFILTKYHNNLYSNIKNKKDWVATWQIFDMFRPIDGNWHHVAVTVQYFDNPAEAERWTEIAFYLDGAPAGRRRFKDIYIEHKGKKLEIGFNSCMGAPWMLGGKIAQPCVYQKLLSQEQIRSLVLQQNLAKPAFTPDKVISPEMLRKIKAAHLTPAMTSALCNIARSTSGHLSIEKILAAPGKYLTELKGRSSSLVLAKTDTFAHPVSFYDHKSERELLRPENPFAEWTLIRKKELSAFDPLHDSVRSSLKKAPVFQNGAWSFVIEYKHPDFKAELLFRYVHDRIEMESTATALKQDKMLYTVSFPKFALNPLTRSGETFVVPYGCGIAYPEPRKENVRFSNPYPRAFNTMQMLAYYDKDTGLYIGCEDPKARVKHTDAGVSQKSITADYIWRVPYEKPDSCNTFRPGSKSALELYRGDWYEAGLIYRRELERRNALWWRKTLPNTDTPEYFRNNPLFINVTYLGEYDQNLIEFRKYLKCDYMIGDVWKWWEEGNNLTPTMRAKPEWIEWVRNLRKHGLRVLPYIDGRLWGKIDRRGEDYFFHKIAAKAAVISDGKEIVERYSVVCPVICPATNVYHKYFGDFIRTLTAQGLDGLYVDQWGATFQPLCDLAKEHGHLYADTEAWYVKGYSPFIKDLRKFWKQKGEQKILTTEDNSEWCVGHLDGVEVYRWISQHQIPLFPLIYSGRVQMYNRHARTKTARFQTVAEQLVNSEQLGSFGIGELISPFNADLRGYMKRAAWIRKAMLPFFNTGMMAHPATFDKPFRTVTRFWDDFGTRYVGKPQVQSGVWNYNGCTAAILVNTEAEPCTNVIHFKAPAQSSELHIFRPGKREEVKVQGKEVSWQFTIPSYGCALLVAVPQKQDASKLLAHIRACFENVHATIRDKDPFDATHLPETTVIPGSKGMNLTDSAVVIGARRNRIYNRIDYVSYAMLYPGVVDFGKDAPSVLNLELACGTPQGGKIKIFADGTDTAHQIGELVLSPHFRTEHWNDYVVKPVTLTKKLTGKHKVIFLVEGLGFVNLKTWNLK